MRGALCACALCVLCVFVFASVRTYHNTDHRRRNKFHECEQLCMRAKMKKRFEEGARTFKDLSVHRGACGSTNANEVPVRGDRIVSPNPQNQW